MRIYLSSADFFPNVGGIAAHVYELSKALATAGNDVHVLTSRGRFQQPKDASLDHLAVHRAYYPHLRPAGAIIYALSIRNLVRRLIDKGHLDILHTHTIFDGVATLNLKNVPKIRTEHSSGFLELVQSERPNLIERLWTHVYARVLRDADHVVGPSNELVEAFVSIGVDPQKTSYIPNGVDTSRFNPEVNGHAIRARYSIEPDTPVVLCPRRLEPKNGVLYFVKAIPNILKNVCDARFLIVGDGSQLAELRQETARLRINDKAIFTGRVANADIAGFYAASDLVVLPSLREATSVAGLEAMACGRAVVGTRTGGIPQIITNGENGLLVAKQDSDALAEAVSSLLIQESTRRRMGRIARQRALREFSWQAIAEKLQRLYADSICLGNS